MGQKKATMTDVAKLSGVSQSTVSLVLNQKSRGAIPPETVSKVLSAAQALHYTKPPRARSQARSEQSVLVLASDPTNPYYSFLLHELDLAAAPHDLHLIFCSTYHNAQREAAFLEIALNSSFQAAIFLYPPDAPAYASQVSCQMPVIAICDKNAVSDIDLIELDNFRAGSIAAEHLVSLGHRNIALISSDPSKSLARSNRIQGVTWQMERCGLRDHLRVVVPGPDEIEHAPGNDIGYRIGRAVAQRPELLSGTYTAFISINDMVAMGVIDALSQHNAQFPGNYSIVSFDNVLYTGLSRISLTTVDYHINLLAQAAIDLLLRRTNPSADAARLSSARFKVECTPPAGGAPFYRSLPELTPCFTRTLPLAQGGAFPFYPFRSRSRASRSAILLWPSSLGWRPSHSIS